MDLVGKDFRNTGLENWSENSGPKLSDYQVKADLVIGKCPSTSSSMLLKNAEIFSGDLHTRMLYCRISRSKTDTSPHSKWLQKPDIHRAIK